MLPRQFLFRTVALIALAQVGSACVEQDAPDEADRPPRCNETSRTLGTTVNLEKFCRGADTSAQACGHTILEFMGTDTAAIHVINNETLEIVYQKFSGAFPACEYGEPPCLELFRIERSLGGGPLCNFAAGGAGGAQ